jgi:tRNA modification GTPase
MLEALPQAASELVVAAVSQQWSAGVSQLASDPDVSAELLRSAARRLPMMQKLLSPPEVVLVGPPNVGKSTLANAIVGREVSIVHTIAGTTRDWVREQALLGGVPIWLTDTAGLFDFPHDPHGRNSSASPPSATSPSRPATSTSISAPKPAKASTIWPPPF